MAWKYLESTLHIDYIIVYSLKRMHVEKKLLRLPLIRVLGITSGVCQCATGTSVITCNQVQSSARKVTIIASDISKFGSDVTVQCSPLNARPIEFHACSASLIAQSPQFKCHRNLRERLRYRRYIYIRIH